MNEPKPFALGARLRSFQYAFRGIAAMIRSQHNAWLHALASAIVITLGITFRITASDWCWLIVSIAIVWTAEALNTALEFLADVASPEFHPKIRDAKDVAAGAVLIAAIAATAIGTIVFWPYLKAI